MFRGTSKINMDAKGRMALPSRYREQLLGDYTGRLVVTIDMSLKCLLLYPIDEWEVIQRKLEELSTLDSASRQLQQLLMGYATDVEMDGSGRILLPQILRDHAKLEKEVALVGMGRKFEIWSEQNWLAHTASLLASGPAKELPEQLRNLSL